MKTLIVILIIGTILMGCGNPMSYEEKKNKEWRIKEECVEKPREVFESDEEKVCPACRLVAFEDVCVLPNKNKF